MSKVLPVGDVPLRYAVTVIGVVSEPEPVELFCASASGTINGIDGGTNNMLTKKSPKNNVKLDLFVSYCAPCLAIKYDHLIQ